MKYIFINLGGMDRIILAEDILSVEIVNAETLDAEGKPFTSMNKWQIVITYKNGDRNVLSHTKLEHDRDMCVEMIKKIAKHIQCTELFTTNDPTVTKTMGSSNPKNPKRDKYNDR